MRAAQLPPIPAMLPKTQPEWDAFRAVMQQWMQILQTGNTASATITTAKLSAATGSMTFVNGLLTSQTPAT